MRELLLNLQLRLLYWVSGFCRIIDGIVILMTLGTINTQFTEEIEREITLTMYKIVYPWMK